MQQVTVDREEYKKFILSEIELATKILMIHDRKLQEMQSKSLIQKFFVWKQFNEIYRNRQAFAEIRSSYMDLYFFGKLYEETENTTIAIREVSPFLTHGRKSIVQFVYNNYYGES